MLVLGAVGLGLLSTDAASAQDLNRESDRWTLADSGRQDNYDSERNSEARQNNGSEAERDRQRNQNGDRNNDMKEWERADRERSMQYAQPQQQRTNPQFHRNYERMQRGLAPIYRY